MWEMYIQQQNVHMTIEVNVNVDVNVNQIVNQPSFSQHFIDPGDHHHLIHRPVVIVIDCGFDMGPVQVYFSAGHPPKTLERC